MPGDFEKTVLRFIESNGLIASNGRVLAAVSGGGDSIALAFCLHRLIEEGAVRASLTIAHVNHCLRGSESDCDEELAAGFGKRLGVDVIRKSVDVRSYSNRRKVSTETAARMLRLGALAEIAGETGCGAVATGHHMDDNTETVIHRLLRGTGYRGLGGIHPMKRLVIDGNAVAFIRPLLCVERSEVIQYCITNNLAWREDHTNKDLVYTRNRIRHGILPGLRRGSAGDLNRQVMDLSIAAQKLGKRLAEEADRQWDSIVKRQDIHTVVLDSGGFSRLPAILAFEITRRALTSIGSGEGKLSRRHYRSIINLAVAANGSTVSLPNGIRACKDKDCVTFQKSSERETASVVGSEAVTLNVPGTTEFDNGIAEAALFEIAECDVAEFKSQKDEFVEWFDYDKLQLPLVVRSRRVGDRFRPFGLNREKKVGKFLTDCRADSRLRGDVRIVCDEKRIIWVAPVRACHETRLTSRTKRVLQIRISTGG
jgi:tRNA(Ile)-lysidine synthase